MRVRREEVYTYGLAYNCGIVLNNFLLIRVIALFAEFAPFFFPFPSPSLAVKIFFGEKRKKTPHEFKTGGNSVYLVALSLASHTSWHACPLPSPGFFPRSLLHFNRMVARFFHACLVWYFDSNFDSEAMMSPSPLPPPSPPPPPPSFLDFKVSWSCELRGLLKQRTKACLCYKSLDIMPSRTTALFLLLLLLFLLRNRRLWNTSFAPSCARSFSYVDVVFGDLIPRWRI